MIELANPWALIAFPIPFLIWFFIPHAKTKLTKPVMVPFFNNIATLINQDKLILSKRNIWFFLYISYLLLLIALSGPKWVGNPQPITQDSYNIMLALDISPSMGIDDMNINGRAATRLEAVKKAAKQFVINRSGDKIGLILFGERAYLLTPLTYDQKNLLMRLDDATVGLAGKSTSTGDALGLAIKKLQDVPVKGRMIVLLTDGASNSGILPPLHAAKIAKDDGIKIYTIGLHSETNPKSFSGMFFNANGFSDLDEDTLRSVAETTGGKYFLATNPKSLQKIYSDIDKITKSTQDEKTIRPQQEYYPWLLVLGFCLFLYLLAKQSNLSLSLPQAGKHKENDIC